jgi:hypothetical protein
MLCPRSLKGLRRYNGVFGIDHVPGAQAGQRGAGRLKCCSQNCRISKAFGIDGLDAADLEKALGEGRARGEVGGRAEVGEKNFRSIASFFQNLIGAVAQALKGRG